MIQPKMKDLEEMKAQYETHGPAFDKPNQASDRAYDSKSKEQAYIKKMVFDRLNSASDCANVSKSEQQAYVEEAKAIIRRNRQLDAEGGIRSLLGKQLDAEKATKYSLEKYLQDLKAANIGLVKQLQDEKPTNIGVEEQLQDEEAADVSLGKQFQDKSPTAVSLEEQLQDEEATKVNLGKHLQNEKSSTVSLEKQVQDVASSDATTPQIERAPHPFCFSGDSIDWREFKLKMRFKMQLDGHLYPTAADRLTYVMTRLKTDAFDEVCWFFKDDDTISIPDKPHADFEDLLQILENAFGPPPRSHTGDSSRRARGRGRNSHRRPYPSDVPVCPPM